MFVILHSINGWYWYATISKLFRFVRLQRVFRYFAGSVKQLQLVYGLIHSFSITLPGIFNVGCLLMLLIFVYAIIGMQLFAKTAYHGTYNENANFRSFYRSIVTLIRFATLDDWTTFMYDAAHDKRRCVEDPDFDSRYCGFNDHPGCIPLNGCGDTTIFPFMLSFVLLVSCVFFNLFISIVLEGFMESASIDNAKISTETLMRFSSYWTKYDPEATCNATELKIIHLFTKLNLFLLFLYLLEKGVIPKQLLPIFIWKLYEPLGFGRSDSCNLEPNEDASGYWGFIGRSITASYVKLC